MWFLWRILLNTFNKTQKYRNIITKQIIIIIKLFEGKIAKFAGGKPDWKNSVFTIYAEKRSFCTFAVFKLLYAKTPSSGKK